VTESGKQRLPRLLRLGRAHYVVFSLALLFILGLSGWFYSSPAVYHYRCIHEYLPLAQKRFGFDVGRVPVPGAGRNVLAVLRVDPAGVLARAGFRPGDIPVDQHGGESAFCAALQGAERGGYSRVMVVNVADLEKRPLARRELEIPSPRE
jgi:hypothetical protein